MAMSIIIIIVEHTIEGANNRTHTVPFSQDASLRETGFLQTHQPITMKRTLNGHRSITRARTVQTCGRSLVKPAQSAKCNMIAHRHVNLIVAHTTEGASNRTEHTQYHSAISRARACTVKHAESAKTTEHTQSLFLKMQDYWLFPNTSDNNSEEDYKWSSADRSSAHHSNMRAIVRAS